MKQHIKFMYKFKILKTGIITSFVFLLLFGCKVKNANESSQPTFSVSNEEGLSDKYKVLIDNQPINVYECRIAAGNDQDRWMSMNDATQSHLYYDMAAFAYFELSKPLTVTIKSDTRISSIKVLPESAGIIPAVTGKKASFHLSNPSNLTVEINGEYIKSLHLFANPPEVDVPNPDDPDVIYFGPGIHRISNLKVESNKTVYFAPEAIVKGVIAPEENGVVNNNTGLIRYAPLITVQGDNVKIKGRGIFDGTLCTTHSRNMIRSSYCNDLLIEGIIFLNPPHWTMPVFNCNNVVIDNIKILGHRANSDGINICNSNDVVVKNCFLRTLDDLVVIKTVNKKGSSKNILVEKCVLWNQVAHAISLGAEMTNNIENVIFRDCDIIHDIGREWCMRIYHTDNSLVKNVLYENIRVEHAKKLISLWIGESGWSHDNERGNIRDVIFKNITVEDGAPLTIELIGYDATHTVEDVLFENVLIKDKPITLGDIQTNNFVRNIAVR